MVPKEIISNLTEDILGTVRESLLVLNKDLKIVYANKSFYNLFNVSQEDTMGRFVYDLGNKQWDIPELRKLLEDIIPEKKTFEDYKVSHVFDDIGKKIMILNAREVINRENGDRMILLAIEDITEKEKLLEYTIQSGKLTAIGQLSAGIAHGLTSPLTGIQNILHVYFEKEEKGSEKYRELKMMLESCDYMAGIIKNLTQFACREKIQFKKIDIVDVIESTLLFTERQLVANNIKLVKDFPKDLGNVNGVKSDLQHVFLNILLNAKESIKDGGKITIKGRQGCDLIVVEIIDDGKGVEKANLDKLFTPFFTTKSEVGGVGLGLSSAYGIIKNHSGKIIAESKKEGGMKITINLPIVK